MLPGTEGGAELSTPMMIPPADPAHARRRRATPRSVLLDAVVSATDADAPECAVTSIWAHASEVARLARDLAPVADVDPHDAGAAGLLHDIGELLLLARRPDDYGALLAAVHDHAGQLDAEKLAFGVDHALLGAEHLLDHRLAHVVADAVADHHDPFRESDPTTIVVAAADEIATGDPHRRHAMDLLGIAPEAAAVLLAAVRVPEGTAER